MADGEPAQIRRLSEFGGADERRLVEAAQRDPARFGDLYEHSFGVVYAYISRRVRDRSETEDLTAEVFSRALTNLPRFKWTGAPVAAWLFRIASNLIADRSKRKAREGNATGFDTEAEMAGNPKLTKQTQQVELEECERRTRLFRLVEALAEDQRRVVVMRFAEEKSIRDIANEMGRSEGAIKQLQFRALGNLRARLASQ
jgi:RNA polymerase sigma-70 factor (ECF subfamily)